MIRDIAVLPGMWARRVRSRFPDAYINNLVRLRCWVQNLPAESQ
jgi:hypothetical protein